jgi:hypothetical protein
MQGEKAEQQGVDEQALDNRSSSGAVPSVTNR